MPLNYGILNEDEVVNALNNKKVSELSNNTRNLLRDLFGVLEQDKIVYCEKTTDFIKPDFIITYDGKKRFVSMKSGRAQNVHHEILENFIEFLQDEGISEETLDTIRLFHYGDGTIDGSGEERKSYQEIIGDLMPRIKKANLELNSRVSFVLKVIDRCVFKGSREENLSADCLYFGSIEYGVVATRNQIEKHIKMRSFSWIDNLHIGPLLLRPDARYVGREISFQRKRDRIIAYWPNLGADIEYIAKRYNF